VETAAYYVALMMLLSSPYILVYWFVLHPLAHYWRRRGPVVTFVVVHSAMLALIAALYPCRETLLRIHFGVSPPLVTLAALFFAVSPYSLAARYLTFSIMVGIPSSPLTSRKLLTEGIYARIRHPRYVEIFGPGGCAFHQLSRHVRSLGHRRPGVPDRTLRGERAPRGS
jgi:protein-S-isoprenylcysteine O-methyltransferase Ste14